MLGSTGHTPPLRAFGVQGKLGRENAKRNPRRTASTAAALMIGLGLVSMVAVLCDLVADRTEVVLTLAGGTSIRGELLAVGAVATVDTGPGGRTAYVPVGAIVSVTRPG